MSHLVKGSRAIVLVLFLAMLALAPSAATPTAPAAPADAAPNRVAGTLWATDPITGSLHGFRATWRGDSQSGSIRHLGGLTGLTDPWDVAVDPRGGRFALVTQQDGRLVRVDLRRRRIEASWELGRDLRGVVIEANGEVALIVDHRRRRLLLFDIEDERVLDRMRVRRRPVDLAVDHSGHYAALSHPRARRMTLIDLEKLLEAAGARHDEYEGETFIEVRDAAMPREPFGFSVVSMPAGDHEGGPMHGHHGDGEPHLWYPAPGRGDGVFATWSPEMGSPVDHFAPGLGPLGSVQTYHPMQMGPGPGLDCQVPGLLLTELRSGDTARGSTTNAAPDDTGPHTYLYDFAGPEHVADGWAAHPNVVLGSGPGWTLAVTPGSCALSQDGFCSGPQSMQAWLSWQPDDTIVADGLHRVDVDGPFWRAQSRPGPGTGPHHQLCSP